MFINGETEKEVTMVKINDWIMKEERSPAQFAHEIGRLAKLDYPSFEKSAMSKVTSDTFILRLPEEMRLEIQKEKEHSQRM